MSDSHYIECVTCGAGRWTDMPTAAEEFRRVHVEFTGHTDFYRGPMPDARARRLGMATDDDEERP